METILEIRKLPGCRLIVFENSGSIRIPLSLYRERPVRAGQQADAGAIGLFIAQRGFPHALDSAVRLLSLCDRTEKEIRGRLSAVGYPAVCIDAVIGRLYDLDLLNDEAFARNWTQSRAHRQGRTRLRQELTRRGVDPLAADQALSELSEEDQLKDAVRLTAKYLGRTHGDMDRKLYQRTLAMLARHGYDADTARKAIGIIARGDDESEWDTEDVHSMMQWHPDR